MSKQYRQARALPLELAQHVQIYFEEELYPQSLNLLLSLLSSSAANPDPTKSPAIVPLPAHLSLASTLTVHPLVTTRTKSPFSERHEASLLALKLLRLTLGIAGPVNGGFDQAFKFKHFDSGLNRHGRGQREHPGTVPVISIDPLIQHGTSGLDPTHNPAQPSSTTYGHAMDMQMRNDFAQNGSLWLRAEDFWACVGWTFNCSVLQYTQRPGNMHEKRWERWEAWLSFMLDLMEEDWRVRQVKAEEQASEPEDKSREHSKKERLKESLIYKYVVSASGDHGRDRRIMRAIFADGSTKSTNEFREIFKNELKEAKKESASTLDQKTVLSESKTRVNIEEDVYGDYVDGQDDDDDSDNSVSNANARPKRRKANRDQAQDSSRDQSPAPLPNNASLFGSTSSLALRLRLMSLLFTLSVQLSDASPPPVWIPTSIIDTPSLNDLFAEFTKYLPLPMFTALLSPSFALPYFELDYYTTLCENLLFRLLEPSAPETEKCFLTQKKLEECFLPFAANSSSAVENAKVSLVLEGLLRAMVIPDKNEESKKGYLISRKSLQDSVDQGIQKREKKVKRKEKGRADEEEAWILLKESGQRMQDVVRRLAMEK